MTTTWLLAVVGGLSVGLAKGGLGGFAFVNIFVMAEILPAKQSIGAVLLMLIVGDLYSVRAYGRFAHWSHVRRLIPPILAGVLIGGLLLHRIPVELFGKAIGWVVIAMIVMQFVRNRFEEKFEAIAKSQSYAIAVGGSAGVCTMLANAAGPLMQLYFLSVRMPKFEFIGTLAWLFLIINLCKVPVAFSLGIVHLPALYLTVMLAPFIVLGVIIAKAIVGIISQQLFEWLVLAFAAVAAFRMILV